MVLAQTVPSGKASKNVANGQENLPLALQHYREFVTATDDRQRSGYAALSVANTLARLGRYSDAEPEFARADEIGTKFSQLGTSVTRARAEMALSRGDWRQAIQLAKSALAAKPRSFIVVDLTRIAGLALTRSGDRNSGLRKCEEAMAAAKQESDPSVLLDTRLALLEAHVAARDSAKAAAVFQDLLPALEDHPESAWRALALMAGFDRQYIGRARDSLAKLDTIWGSAALQDYLKRPDLHELSRPLLPLNFATH